MLLHILWEKSKGVVPVYLNLMEDKQRKEKREKVEINNSLLVSVESNAVLGTKFYPRECKDWKTAAAHRVMPLAASRRSL